MATRSNQQISDLPPGRLCPEDIRLPQDGMAGLQQNMESLAYAPRPGVSPRPADFSEAFHPPRENKNGEEELPIAAHRTKILQLIRNNPVVCIQGETGCGKSTMVPRYIWEDNVDRNKCRIVVTQPRRIACISLAARVASQLNSPLGELVGYRIAGESNVSNRTCMTFVTTGFLLQLLVNNPSSLSTYTHVILDEVHERNIEADLLSLVLKLNLMRGFSKGPAGSAVQTENQDANAQAPHFKLIVMSATLQNSLFSQYFASPTGEVAPSIHVGAKRYPVGTLFLEDIFSLCSEQFDMRSFARYDQMLSALDNNSAVEQHGSSAAPSLGFDIARALLFRNIHQNRIMDSFRLPDDAYTAARLAVVQFDKAATDSSSRRKTRVTTGITKDPSKSQLAESEDDADTAATGGDGHSSFSGTMADENESDVQTCSLAPSVLPGLDLVVMDLVRKLAVPSSTVLIFLSGIGEIHDLYETLHRLEFPRDSYHHSAMPPAVRYKLFVLHSTISREEQEGVFKPPAADCVHVVLASNIAESSLTLPCVRLVIDFGLRRKMVTDPRRHCSSLIRSWVSVASCDQRKGRTGRVSAGLCIRLFSRSFYNHCMSRFDAPEIETAPLEKLYITASYLCAKINKIHNVPNVISLVEGLQTGSTGNAPTGTTKRKLTPSELLQLTLEPPSVEPLQSAVKTLNELGSLSMRNGEEHITVLGHFMMHLPLDIHVCRLVLFSIYFGVPCDGIVLAAALSSMDAFTTPNQFSINNPAEYSEQLQRASQVRSLFDAGNFSEPLMTRNMFVQWFVGYAKEFALESNMNSKQAMMKSIRNFSKNYSVVHKRLMYLAMTVADISARVQKLIVPSPSNVTLQALEKLSTVMQGSYSGQHRHHPGNAEVLFKDSEYSLLLSVLVASFSSQFLIGTPKMLFQGALEPRSSNIASVRPSAAAMSADALVVGDDAPGGAMLLATTTNAKGRDKKKRAAKKDANNPPMLSKHEKLLDAMLSCGMDPSNTLVLSGLPSEFRKDKALLNHSIGLMCYGMDYKIEIAPASEKPLAFVSFPNSVYNRAVASLVDSPKPIRHSASSTNVRPHHAAADDSPRHSTDDYQLTPDELTPHLEDVICNPPPNVYLMDQHTTDGGYYHLGMPHRSSMIQSHSQPCFLEPPTAAPLGMSNPNPPFSAAAGGAADTPPTSTGPLHGRTQHVMQLPRNGSFDSFGMPLHARRGRHGFADSSSHNNMLHDFAVHANHPRVPRLGTGGMQHGPRTCCGREDGFKLHRMHRTRLLKPRRLDSVARRCSDATNAEREYSDMTPAAHILLRYGGSRWKFSAPMHPSRASATHHRLRQWPSHHYGSRPDLHGTPSPPSSIISSSSGTTFCHSPNGDKTGGPVDFYRQQIELMRPTSLFNVTWSVADASTKTTGVCNIRNPIGNMSLCPRATQTWLRGLPTTAAATQEDSLQQDSTVVDGSVANGKMFVQAHEVYALYSTRQGNETNNPNTLEGVTLIPDTYCPLVILAFLRRHIPLEFMYHISPTAAPYITKVRIFSSKRELSTTRCSPVDGACVSTLSIGDLMRINRLRAVFSALIDDGLEELLSANGDLPDMPSGNTRGNNSRSKGFLRVDRSEELRDALKNMLTGGRRDVCTAAETTGTDSVVESSAIELGEELSDVQPSSWQGSGAILLKHTRIAGDILAKAHAQQRTADANATSANPKTISKGILQSHVVSLDAYAPPVNAGHHNNRRSAESEPFYEPFYFGGLRSRVERWRTNALNIARKAERKFEEPKKKRNAGGTPVLLQTSNMSRKANRRNKGNHFGTPWAAAAPIRGRAQKLCGAAQVGAVGGMQVGMMHAVGAVHGHHFGDAQQMLGFVGSAGVPAAPTQYNSSMHGSTQNMHAGAVPFVPRASAAPRAVGSAEYTGVYGVPHSGGGDPYYVADSHHTPPHSINNRHGGMHNMMHVTQHSNPTAADNYNAPYNRYWDTGNDQAARDQTQLSRGSVRAASGVQPYGARPNSRGSAYGRTRGGADADHMGYGVMAGGGYHHYGTTPEEYNSGAVQPRQPQQFPWDMRYNSNGGVYEHQLPAAARGSMSSTGGDVTTMAPVAAEQYPNTYRSSQRPPQPAYYTDA